MLPMVSAFVSAVDSGLPENLCHFTVSTARFMIRGLVPACNIIWHRMIAQAVPRQALARACVVKTKVGRPGANRKALGLMACRT